MIGYKKLLSFAVVGALAFGVFAAGRSAAFAVTTTTTPSDSSFDFSWSTDDGSGSYYTTNTLTGAEAAGLAGFFAVYMGFVLCMMVVVYLYSAITTFATAKKLGTENRWMAFVPVLSTYLMNNMAGLESWMFLLAFVPGINLVYAIYVYMKIAERRGFENWVGLLILVPFIGMFIPAYIAWGTPSPKVAVKA